MKGTDDIFQIIPAPGAVLEEGTPINMATLLKRTTGALLGLGEAAVPDDALVKLKDLADHAVDVADSKCRIALVSREGTGTYGPSGPCSLTLPFAAKMVMYLGASYMHPTFGTHYVQPISFGGTVPVYCVVCPQIYTTEYLPGGFASSVLHSSGYYIQPMCAVSADKKTITWYLDDSRPDNQFNELGHTYYFLALG